MSNVAQFPAQSVLDWYKEAESMLEDFLRYVPYCDGHEGVWSPKLVIILQETCSQLDSLWRWEAANVHGRQGNVDIRDYFRFYGVDMAPRWAVFWADEPRIIEPFGPWQKAKKFSKKDSSKYPLDWWKEGYQKIKHSRLDNPTCANLKRTVDALGGLFLAIVRSEDCWNSLWENHWMSGDDIERTPFDPLDCLRADFGLKNDENKCNTMHLAVESRLFTYGVGLCSNLIAVDKSPHWQGDCSCRFKAWYQDYCKRNDV